MAYVCSENIPTGSRHNFCEGFWIGDTCAFQIIMTNPAADTVGPPCHFLTQFQNTAGTATADHLSISGQRKIIGNIRKNNIWNSMIRGNPVWAFRNWPQY